MSYHNNIKTAFVLTIILFTISIGNAFADGPVFSKFGAAIRGYDTVAYFTEQKPVKGQKKYTYKWRDANWRFASQENLDTFKSNPEKYAPQYGGFCAYAAAQDYRASTVPEAWAIIDDKLYLNFNIPVNNTWRSKADKYIEQGDKHWAALIAK